ncbi:MAG: prepilin-type N-terminal cleavage/methylation domain-containing protein [Candidatus Didemnitutus sp.]|nr:prepilin-type N-terminal cleavage/methylation domain-containing protein [Candidatus Didemnitutus sp.]
MISSAPRRAASGFTLLELLVVVGLISAFSFILINTLGTTRGAALQSAQGMLANLIVAARTKAAASGQSSRILIQFDATSNTAATRFLRHLVLQVQVSGTWQSLTEVYLPEGTYILPGNYALPLGLLAATDTPWTRPSDNQDMRSTALRSGNITVAAINGGTTEQWTGMVFSANGTTTNSNGALIVAAGRPRAPASYGSGESPVELLHPEQVRGLSISTYGVAALINSRAGF